VGGKWLVSSERRRPLRQPPCRPHLINQTALIGHRTCVAGIANQLADSFFDLFSANVQGRIVVELVFLAQLFQIVTFLAFFL
jgi:hypothetical protein